MHLRYWCLSSLEDFHLEKLKAQSGHPQHVMEALGITYQHATPQSICDQWWFWNCENVPQELPNFLTELKADPMECIGFGLNEETAKKLKKVNNEYCYYWGHPRLRCLYN